MIGMNVLGQPNTCSDKQYESSALLTRPTSLILYINIQATECITERRFSLLLAPSDLWQLDSFGPLPDWFWHCPGTDSPCAEFFSLISPAETYSDLQKLILTLLDQPPPAETYSDPSGSAPTCRNLFWPFWISSRLQKLIITLLVHSQKSWITAGRGLTNPQGITKFHHPFMGVITKFQVPIMGGSQNHRIWAKSRNPVRSF